MLIPDGKWLGSVGISDCPLTVPLLVPFGFAMLKSSHMKIHLRGAYGVRPATTCQY